MTFRDRLLATAVAVLWGGNFLAIHVGLQHFPPLFMAALRFAVIAVPTLLLVPRPRVPLRWLLGYGLGFGTVQFVFLFVAMDIGMPTGPPGWPRWCCRPRPRSPCCWPRPCCASRCRCGRGSGSGWP
jgi:drug/metabolite transporter (DMT)-like permease